MTVKAARAPPLLHVTPTVYPPRPRSPATLPVGQAGGSAGSTCGGQGRVDADLRQDRLVVVQRQGVRHDGHPVGLPAIPTGGHQVGRRLALDLHTGLGPALLDHLSAAKAAVTRRLNGERFMT
jgi:hypothetical protein